MNANELADELLKVVNVSSHVKMCASDMLRRQQAEIDEWKYISQRLESLIKNKEAEIEALKAKTKDEPNWKEMYWWMHELNHKHWSELDALKTHPAKTLTDEEILDTFNYKFDYLRADENLIDFARAILRKAQEK